MSETNETEKKLEDATTAKNAADEQVLAESRSQTRRAFAVGAVAAAAGYGFYRYVDRAKKVEDLSAPLRRSLQTNAAVSREVLRDAALTPTYPLKRAETLRVNGVYGLKKALAMESWRLQVYGARDAEKSPRYVKDITAWEYKYAEGEGHEGGAGEDRGHDTKVDPAIEAARKLGIDPKNMVATQDDNQTGRAPRGLEEAGESDSTLNAGTPGLLLTMDDVLKLPRHELVTQFKCIEGWSQIVHWAGVRMADFLEAYPPAAVDGQVPKYVYMETPDGDFYTGYDLHVLRHPQALLVTEMMGAPLTQFHGAPLRLHLPMKYGYKQIKRIGLIAYMADKPDDYWTRLGYDWYAGL